MDDLAQAQDEIRKGNFASAEAVLDRITARLDGISSHLLFDLTSAYEELFTAAGRYEELIRISRRLMAAAGHLPALDMQIHSSHALMTIAKAEIALGRRENAERNMLAAQHLLERFPAERFAASSRARVNSMRVRLKALQKTPGESIFSLRSSGEIPENSRAGEQEWCAFASQKHLSAREVKAWLARLRRQADLPTALAVIVEWALNTPRSGGIGSNPETFAAFVDELTSLTLAHTLSFDIRRKLSRMVHIWDEQDAAWLQRMIIANRKSGLAEKLQVLRRALEKKVQHALNSIDKRLGLLESSDAATILDGAGDQDYEAEVLSLDSELEELRDFVPSLLAGRFVVVQDRLARVIAAVDHEILRRNEAYARLYEAAPRASSGAALADLKNEIKQQLPQAMQERGELQDAIRQAEDRLVIAELEELEVRERATLRSEVERVRGVDLANLLFRDYGIDLPTARRLVIDRNNGAIDLEQLLDRILDIQRRRPFR